MHGFGDETADLGTGHITFKLAVDLDFILTDNLHTLANKFEVILDHHSRLIRHDAHPLL